MSGFRLLLAAGIAVSALAMSVCGAMAQTPRFSEIPQQVAALNGYLDQRNHDEFWASLPSVTQAEPYQFERFHTEVLEALKRKTALQKAFFLSIKMTLEAGKITKAPGLQAAWDAEVAAGRISREAVEKQDRIMNENLALALQGKPVKTSRGEIYVNPFVADLAPAALDSAFARVQLLLDPAWREERREFQYPDAHVAIVSVLPFTKMASRYASSGDPASTQNLFQALDGNDQIHVTWLSPEKPPGDGDEFLAKTMDSVFRGALAVPSGQARTTEWQGHRALRQVGVSQIQNTYVVAVVVDHLSGGVTTLLSTSLVSQEQADRNLDSLNARSRYVP